MTSLSKPSVVCIGVHIVDTLGRPVTDIPPGQGRRLLEQIMIGPAGTAAGTAVDLAKLGAAVINMGAVGDDALADFLETSLSAAGVDTTRLTRKSQAQTSATILPIRPNGERPALHCPGATGLLTRADIDMEAVRGAAAVHLGGPDVCGAFGTDGAAEVLTAAREEGAITTLDVLSRGDSMTWEQLARLLALTDCFMPNDEQLLLFSGEATPEAGAAKALAAGAGAVLVSCGPEGALLVDADGEYRVPALSPSVHDSTGCGDAVSAGWIVAKLAGATNRAAAWIGMAAARFTGSGLGSGAGDYDFVRCVALAREQAPDEIARELAGLSLTTDDSALPTGDAALPSYRELPEAPHGGRSAWGLFDDTGLFNLQTPERVAAAGRLIRTGQVFSLNCPITVPDPPLYRRGAPEHTLMGSPKGFDDKLDNFYPQASSQWDSLAHVAYQPDMFYNGITSDDVRAGRSNTIDRWARRGIAGRAVLLDVEQVLRERDPGYDPSLSRGVTVEELETARTRAGVELGTGDVVLVNFGFLAWYGEQDAAVKERLADTTQLTAVGLEHSEEMAEYLWDHHVCAVAGDNPAVEMWPPTGGPGPFDFLHRMLIGQFGIAIGELFWLADLTNSCRTDGRYEMFMTAAPLNVPGGVGSPANALVIK